MVGEHGYKVAKFITEGHAVYRACRGGNFIGSPQESFEDAAAVCENNLAIMGELEGEHDN